VVHGIVVVRLHVPDSAPSKVTLIATVSPRVPVTVLATRETAGAAAALAVAKVALKDSDSSRQVAQWRFLKPHLSKHTMRR
jgi:hypothetical protein